MASTYVFRHSDISASGDVHTAADVFVLTPARPINVIRWGFIFTVALTAAAFVAAGDKRITAGSDTGRVDGATSAAGVDTAGGVISTSAGRAAGRGLYHNVSPKCLVNPGEQFVIQITTGVAAGTGFSFVEYEEEGFTGGDPAIAQTDANRISYMLKV